MWDSSSTTYTLGFAYIHPEDFSPERCVVQILPLQTPYSKKQEQLAEAVASLKWGDQRTLARDIRAMPRTRGP